MEGFLWNERLFKTSLGICAYATTSQAKTPFPVTGLAFIKHSFCEREIHLYSCLNFCLTSSN